MTIFFMILWYCMDDSLASWLGNPAFGTVPWPVAFVVSLILSIFLGVVLRDD